MPPQNETAFVLFKLGLQNIRKLLHIANGIVLFPERAVVPQYSALLPAQEGYGQIDVPAEAATGVAFPVPSTGIKPMRPITMSRASSRFSA